MTELFGRPPAVPRSLAECSFYHTIKLPGHGVLPGLWDLRGH